MSDLRCQTLVITGASRAIGKAIGLRAARDGANVAVVAKTAEPHPTLPGTVYSAVEEIEAAGGRGLACVETPAASNASEGREAHFAVNF